MDNWRRSQRPANPWSDVLGYPFLPNAWHVTAGVRGTCMRALELEAADGGSGSGFRRGHGRQNSNSGEATPRTPARAWADSGRQPVS
jgi:hypothetical protein